MNEDYFDKYKRPPAILPLTEKEKMELFNLLLKLLAGTKTLKIQTIFSGVEDYRKFQDKLNIIGIKSVMEEMELGRNTYNIEIVFTELLGYLLDFDKIKYDGGVNDE